MRQCFIFVVALMVLSGCSSSPVEPQDSNNAAPTSSDSMAAQSTRTEQSDETTPATSASPASTQVAVDAASRLKDAGIACGGQQLVGDIDCTWEGKQITVSTGVWTDTAAKRKQACDEGFINTSYVVATDGDHLTITTDQNSDTQTLATKLGLKIETYCP